MSKEIILSEAISKGFGNLLIDNKNQKENIDKRIDELENVIKYHVSLNDFINIFNKIYAINNHGDKFDPNANNKEALNLQYTILYWLFREDESFTKSPLLNKEINNPNINKSLCIIGGVGCGKTTIIETFMTICRKANDQFVNLKVKACEDDNILIPLKAYLPNFRTLNANKIVEMYESCITQQDKATFWRTVTKGNIYFDDILTERQASNYGKVELFKDIFERRYESGSNLKTIVSMNYCKLYDQTNKLYEPRTPKGGGNLRDTMDVIYSKYGMRVEDRFYQIFNFIEMYGASLRK
jgi:hypothetical protein